jgi:hypothetical protein
MVAREGVDGRQIIAFVIGVLLTVASKEAAWRVGPTVVGVTCRVNRIVAGSFPRMWCTPGKIGLPITRH